MLGTGQRRYGGSPTLFVMQRMIEILTKPDPLPKGVQIGVQSEVFSIYSS